jgi:hypothetical protein
MGHQKPTVDVDLGAILDAASGLGPGASRRSRYIEVAALINRHFPAAPVGFRTVEKWFSRNSVTGAWLIRLVAAGAKEGRTIDLSRCLPAAL